MTANTSQRRPVQANAGQQGPKTANDGQRRSARANDGSRRPTQATEVADLEGSRRDTSRALWYVFFALFVNFTYLLHFYMATRQANDDPQSQRRPARANEDQHRPTPVNEDPRRPKMANAGQHEPTKANAGQRRPTQATEVADSEGSRRDTSRALWYVFLLLFFNFTY
jgi:hypothetical protein